jgi:transposase
MLSITRLHRCYLYRGRTDMRKGIDSLCGMVRNELGKDPLSGELFIFFCRQRRRVKILLWDEDGFALYQKRLERGTFEMPEGNTAHQDISAGQLNLILSGVNLKKVSHRPRYQHTIHNAFTGHVV